nr:unnamed protein product [Callosobruchus chinensis]CAH7732130.1 unnamed protein product [Callosobruchus chinensis]CAH7739362.1 unnamed protein product [Callosobruchus chinensis]
MFIIDVQGFNYGSNTFICKEIAIINIKTGVYRCKLVNIPICFKLLNITVQKHMKWLSYNYHGLEWSSDHKDHLNYEQLSDFIKNVVKNEIVFVKGVDKKVWLERFVTNQIIDLHNEGCPNLVKLKMIYKSVHCNQHLFNHLSCALENVTLLHHWYNRNKRQ